METPQRNWKLEMAELEIAVKESYRKDVEPAQKKELCFSQQSWKKWDIKRHLTSPLTLGIEIQNLEFTLLGFGLALV